MDKAISVLLIKMVRDLEETREKFSGYAYVRTIRNILVGKEDAIIAPHFHEQTYYGMLDYLTLEETEGLMESLVKTNQLAYIFTEHGKLYCTLEYHENMCKKRFGTNH